MNRLHLRPAETGPLSSTAVEVTITDLVAAYEIRHSFQNDRKSSIEAVFSFPVPLDAVFMGMEATLAGETLTAMVLPAARASRDYDDAIAEGDSAVLLKMPEPGLLCVNLGNLKPGEKGLISLRFVTPIHVADRCARFSLPTVHRPRYGNWNLEEFETPVHDFAVEHPMTATIRVTGLLARASVHCASHPAQFALEGDTLLLKLGHAMLDRDVVLTFEMQRELAPVGRLVEDNDASIGMISFAIPELDVPRAPLDLCLVLDGSGSMTGDAVEQSRLAVASVVEALAEDDRIQVLRFGSSVVPMFRRPLRATARVRESLISLIDTVNSDLGGTEIGDALEQALEQLARLDNEGRTRVIILVTDGAVQPHSIVDAQTAARDAGVRVFVVAVGGSAGVEVLAPLAEATAGTVERAVPAEPIDACVMRQFRRARTEPVDATVTWPGHGVVGLPMGVVYPGDAVTAAASLPAEVSGEALVHVPSLLEPIRVSLSPRETAPALRALFGSWAYLHAEAALREGIALRYGLVTKETSAVLVKVRASDDKSSSLPTIVPVAHMIPEGMVAHLCAFDTPHFLRRAPDTRFSRAASSTSDHVDEATWLRLNREHCVVRRLPAMSAARVRELLNTLYLAVYDAFFGEAHIDLASAVVQLPEEQYEDARELVWELLDFDLDNDFDSRNFARLLGLLAQFAGDRLSDDQEAAIAVALARYECSPYDSDQLQSALENGLPERERRERP